MGCAVMDSAKWWYYTQQNGGYYPQSLASLGYNVWDWDASRLTGVVNGTPQTLLYQDSAKTTPVTANSDPVGAWVDGVSGVDAVQATAGARPTYTTNSLNGKPTLAFDGGDLLATASIGISSFAIWVVFRASADAFVYEHSVFTNTNQGTLLRTIASGALSINRGTLASKNGTALTDSTYRVVRVEYNDTIASFLYYGNGANITTSTSATEPGTGTATQPFFIGARSGGTLGLVGDIAHVCLVSPYPGARLVASTESYINSKWQLY